MGEAGGLRRGAWHALVVVAFGLCTTPAYAHFLDRFLPFSPEQSDQCASGDWAGHRNRLYDAGVNLTGDYAASFLGNPVGGQARGFAYAGMFTLGVDFDLEKLVGFTGSSVYTSLAWATGRSLSTEYIGNDFAASTIFGGDSLRLYRMYVQQKVFDGDVVFRAGRIVTGNDFAVSPLYNVFLSLSMNGNPVSLLLNDSAFQAIPLAAWGARVAYAHGDSGWYARFGAYNGSARELGLGSAHGVDFGFDPAVSTLLIGESGVKVPAATGALAGQYRIGGYFDTGALPTLADPDETGHGLYTVYALVDQQLTQHENCDDPARGLSAFAAFAAAPRQELSLISYFGAAGLVYKGLIDGRGDDQLGINLAYGAISSASEGSYEMATELTYVVAVTPWMTVQPDVQVIVHPGIPTTLVVGGAINMGF